MLKRAFWLSLFCLAFFLLVGLMVRGEADLQQQPPRVQAFFALMPTAQAAKEQAPAQQDVLKADQPSYAEAFQRRADGPRLPKVPYHRQAYHAFHYPDKAG